MHVHTSNIKFRPFPLHAHTHRQPNLLQARYATTLLKPPLKTMHDLYFQQTNKHIMTTTTLVKTESFLGKEGLANELKNISRQSLNPSPTLITGDDSQQQILANSTHDHFSGKFANPSSADRSSTESNPDEVKCATLHKYADPAQMKDPNTPTTSSCASLKSMESTTRTGLSHVLSESAVPLTPSEKKINTSPKCTSFVGEDDFPNSMAIAIECIDTSEDQQKQELSPRPQHEELDPDLSIGSSVASSFGSNPLHHYSAEPLIMDPPTYIASGRTNIVSPIKDQNKHTPGTRRRWQGRKVQPLVYSAIGSLENIHQSSFGSFNDKLDKASISKKIKKKKGHVAVDVNATTSQINARTRIVQKKSPIDKSSNSTKKLSTLGSTLKKESVGGKGIVTGAVGIEYSVRIDGAEKNDLSAVGQSKRDNSNNAASSLTPLEKSNTQLLKTKKRGQKKKKVRIDSKPDEIRHVELFRPSCDAYTPRMGKEIKYKPAEQRLKSMGDTVHNVMGTIQKPNFQDALRRVAMIIHQHIVKIEQRFQSGADHLNLFEPAMRDAFSEENFITPRYKCTMVNVPMARGGVMYGMRKIRVETKIPTADDIYEFGHRLFKQVQLSSECSIICLIYVERIMEAAKVPMLAKTWKPIFMCGLLLASKVWQDWSSWNIEFANVYPQFSLESINRLEIQFLTMVKWDLYISSSLYAKYYFALRSLLEKQDFRRRYVRMVGGVDSVSASQAMKVSKRSELLKEKSLACLSRSV